MTTPSTPSDPMPEEPAVQPDRPAIDQPPYDAAPESPVVDVETPGRRRMRTFLRSLALAAIMFALGAAVSAVLLYRPADLQRKSAWVEATMASGEYAQLERTATAAEGSNKAAQVRMQQAEQALDVERGRVFLLRASNEITRARMALVSGDQAAADQALTAAAAHLEGLQPPLMVLNKDQLDTLTALFTLTKNDLGRDPALASQDLDRLQSELDLAEQGLEP